MFWGELRNLLSAEWERFGVSIAWAMSMLEKPPAQKVGTVSGASERFENMERKAAPTDADRVAVAGFGVS